MSSTKKQPKAQEDLQSVLQKLIAQGQKEGILRASDLSAALDKLNLPSEKLEEIYDQLEAMNIQIVSADLDLDLDDAVDLDLMDGLDDDLDLSELDEEDLVDPVDLAASSALCRRRSGTGKACQRGRPGRKE